MVYQGKEVLTQDTFSYETARPGDFVEQAVVDDADELYVPGLHDRAVFPDGYTAFPPSGPQTGHWRATYATFKRCLDASGVWEYCGYCFQAKRWGGAKSPYSVLTNNGGHLCQF